MVEGAIRGCDALVELNVEADVQKVTDLKKISEYKVFATPALVINGKVKASGASPLLKKSRSGLRKNYEDRSRKSLNKDSVLEDADTEEV